MRSSIMALAGATLVLTGCGEPSSEADSVERLTTVDIAEPEMDTEASISGGEIPVSLPQIAYVYDYGFRITGEAIPVLQERHVAQCEALGPEQCRVLEMRNSGSAGDYANGYLNLAVASQQARTFGTQLAESATSQGGEQVSSSIAGEDLSKQIVDTEARLRARTTLRDRLMDILKNREGDVAELVEAERSVAQVNEEIDQAQSWLAEMRGRVNFSRINLRYESIAPASGGFMEPIRQAFGSIGTIFGMTIAAIIFFLTVALPVGLLLWGGLAIRSRIRHWQTTNRAGEDALAEN